MAGHSCPPQPSAALRFALCTEMGCHCAAELMGCHCCAAELMGCHCCAAELMGCQCTASPGAAAGQDGKKKKKNRRAQGKKNRKKAEAAGTLSMTFVPLTLLL